MPQLTKTSWDVTDDIRVHLIPDGDEPEYHDALDNLVKKNKDDYVPWSDYALPDGTPQDGFFWNYRSDDERLLIAKHSPSNELCGFATVDTPSTRSDIPVSSPFTYYSLMLVDKAYRGKGIATTFYKAVLLDILPELNAPNPVVVGTWETNDAQIHLLDKFDFTCLATKPDHRITGEATLYYGCYI